MAVWPPSSLPTAQGLPGSSGPHTRLLFFPFRCVRPMGWMGVRYRTSKPMAAMAGRRASASRKVALRPGTVPCDRGKISYQAPKRAFSRSTQTGHSTQESCASSFGSSFCIMANRSSASISSQRWSTFVVARTATRWRSSAAPADADACDRVQLDERLALGELERHVLPRPELLLEAVAP